MAKKIDYTKLFTLRSDGRYVAKRKVNGQTRYFYDRDPERLYSRITGAEKPIKHTFPDVAEQWQDEHTKQVSFKTAETYTAPLRRLCDYFGDSDVREITASEIDAFLRDLGQKKYSRRSVQLHRDILNMIFNFSILQGYLTANPCAAVSMPKNLPTSRRELPTDEALKAVQDNPDAPFALFAFLCLYAGLRRGEALALRYEDIDRLRGVLCVCKAVSFQGNNPVIKEPKTSAGNREVVLLTPLADILPTKKHGFLFTDHNGRLLSKMQFRDTWQRYCDAIGHQITPHQLRHGYATILYEAGVQDKDAQELLGHSSIQVTRNVYTHIRASKKQETANRLNDYIKNKVF